GRGVRELVARRGYMGEDRHWLGSVGACSGYMSVLVLALYITSDEVRVLYGHPEVLWLICPLLLYWICRMWLRAYRGELHEDPVVAAARDRSSYVVGAMIGATMLLAALYPGSAMQEFRSWGRYPALQHRDIVPLHRHGEPPDLSRIAGPVLPVGCGRSYGDSCLNEGGVLLDARPMRELLDFDAETGVLRCEAGATLGQILEAVVPRGWFLP